MTVVGPCLHKHLQGLLFTEEAQRYLVVIEENFQQDFSTSGRGYFSFDNEMKIADKAFAMLKVGSLFNPVLS